MRDIALDHGCERQLSGACALRRSAVADGAGERVDVGRAEAFQEVLLLRRRVF